MCLLLTVATLCSFLFGFSRKDCFKRMEAQMFRGSRFRHLAGRRCGRGRMETKLPGRHILSGQESSYRRNGLPKPESGPRQQDQFKVKLGRSRLRSLHISLTPNAHPPPPVSHRAYGNYGHCFPHTSVYLYT